MRPRGSLLGPVIILGIGVLFLLKNFRPDIPAWELLGKYWPVLLIVWGLVKLAQVARPPQPGVLPRPVLTVGEFFLALLLIVIGTAVYKGTRFVQGADWNEIWGESYTFPQEVKQAVEEKQPSILVVNPYGETRVTGGDLAEIQVKAERRVKARNEANAKETADSTQVEITREGSQYVVRSNADRARGGRSVQVTLEIHVPRASTLDLQTRRGDIQVSDIRAPVTISAERGDVTLADIGGKVRLDLRRGSLSAQRLKGNLEMDGRGSDIQVTDVDGEVVVRGDYTGSITFANISGAVRMTSSRTDLQVHKLPGKVDMTIGSLHITDSSGPLTITTRAKDIVLEEFQGPVQVTNRDASIELRTRKLPLKDIEVENRGGGIELTLPASSNFQIDASARRGNVDSEFVLPVQVERELATIKGTVGSNGANIKLKTTFGTIHLRKM